jgi:hypothetical protein
MWRFEIIYKILRLVFNWNICTEIDLYFTIIIRSEYFRSRSHEGHLCFMDRPDLTVHCPTLLPNCGLD